MSTYSIALRMRRVRYEDAYIAVPVTDAIMQKTADGSLKEAEDGHFRIDPDALWAEAIRLSQDDRVEWQLESTSIEPHPIQQSPPEGRRKVDFFYDAPDRP